MSDASDDGARATDGVSDTGRDEAMTDWIDFAEWARCEELARPGIVFEVSNGTPEVLTTPCVVPFVMPPSWTAPPLYFRPVVEDAPVRSDPLPPPTRPRD